MAGTITIGGLAAGLPTGAKTLGPLTFTGTNVIGEIIDIALASGDNAITVPTGANAVVIVPPAGNTTTIKVRTSLNSGDGGTPINPGTGFYVLCFPSTAPTSVTLNAGSAISALTEVWFI